VEHQKLKSFHFATDNSSDRAAWVDALTHAATLQNDDNDDARLQLWIPQLIFCFVIMLDESGNAVIFVLKFVHIFESSDLILMVIISRVLQ